METSIDRKYSRLKKEIVNWIYPTSHPVLQVDFTISTKEHMSFNVHKMLHREKE